MKQKQLVVITAIALALVAADLSHGIHGHLFLIPDANAVVGRPLTPVSVAGVARRTTRRAIYATSMYVPTLPPACTVVNIEGTMLHQCGGTYYQQSGSQYVVVNVS